MRAATKGRGIRGTGSVMAAPNRIDAPNSPADWSASSARNDSRPRPVPMAHRMMREGMEGSWLTGSARPASANRSGSEWRIVVHPAPPCAPTSHTRSVTGAANDGINVVSCGMVLVLS